MSIVRIIESAVGNLVTPLVRRAGKWMLLSFLAGVVLVVRWFLQQPGWAQVLIVAAALFVVVGLMLPDRRRSAVVAVPRPERRPMPRWLREQIIERDQGICGICGFGVKAGTEHIDHIDPVWNGGTDQPDNLQTAHSECNLRKGGMVGWVSPWKRAT